MRDLKAFLLRVAASDSNVLITGETGTGKDIVAELIHENDARRRGPFVRVNCAAVPETLVESELFGHEKGAFTGADCARDGLLKAAAGGTVFFDEIGDMSPFAQAKILRAVENHEIHRLGSQRDIPVDFRVLAATHRDLEKDAFEGRFRQDLYFRLNVSRIHVPPLRERKEDIPLLFDHYIRVFRSRRGLDVEGLAEDALESLVRYDWPGNVRELKNLVESSLVVATSRRISFADLPEDFRARLRRSETPQPGERERLVSALVSTRWNKTEAASRLNWSRMTLYRKMAKYEIEAPSPKERPRHSSGSH
jgi:two-component system response regulator HydG/two-component system response regulator AtoC